LYDNVVGWCVLRAQVEHTVTEEITGIDIVQTQVKIAGGASLAELGLGSQELVPAPKGFAIQCRVTSEDPEQNFQVRTSSNLSLPELCRLYHPGERISPLLSSPVRAFFWEL
jgi:acetyl/propionyl-CoA carboxylase alpha subunit